MPDNRNDNQIQRNQQRPYFTDSQVITGCLATGEQKVVRRSTRWEHIPSAQELRGEVRDMLNQANQLPDRGLLEQRNYDTGNSSSLTRSQQNAVWNNAVNSLRNIRVPLYDSQGRQIVGQDNVKREVERREAEWAATHGGRPPLSEFEFGPTIGPIQIPTYDEYGRLITDQQALEAEVARREAEWRQWEREGRIQSGEQRTITTANGTFTVNTRGLNSTSGESENLYSRFEEIAESSSTSQVSSNRSQGQSREVERQSKPQQEVKYYPQFRRK